MLNLIGQVSDRRRRWPTLAGRAVPRELAQILPGIQAASASSAGNAARIRTVHEFEANGIRVFLPQSSRGSRGKNRTTVLRGIINNIVNKQVKDV